MSNSAILAISIVGNATSAVTAFNKTRDGAQAMRDGLDKASRAATLALGAITAAAWGAASAASEAEQAVGAVQSVFGSVSDDVLKQAESAAQAVGLSKQAYNQLASVLGAQLKNMGVSSSQLAAETDTLIRLGADLSATFGGTTADAVAALSSLMRGERDPIERYGVSIKAADIQARLASQGLSELEGEALRMAETQATLALLTEQTAAAQGQFGRETDTAAGQMQIARAEWDNAVAQLGEQLLPLLVTGAQLLSDFATWVSENSDQATALAITIGSVSAGILLVNGALKAYQLVQGAATAAQWAFNTAMKANPATKVIMLIVAALGAVTVALESFGISWEDIFAGIIGMVKGLLDWLGGIIDGINDLLGLGGGQQRRMVDTATRTRVAESAGGGGGTTVNNYNYDTTVQGALDVDGTARTISQVMGEHATRTGRDRGESKWRTF